MRKILYVWSALAFVVPCAQAGGPRAWQERVEAGVLGPKIELKSVDTSNWALKDARAAVEKAERVLGVPRGTHQATAELIKLEDDNTPFLTMKLLFKPLWHVVVHDWRLDSPSAPTEARENSYTRTFDVLVRPEDGRVLKIRSRWPKGEPMMVPEHGASSATCQIYGGGYTVYHDFPDNDPRVSLLEALVSLYDDHGGDPLTAKQILAIPVVWSNCYYQTPRCVWVINLRGVMPVHRASPQGKPEYEYRFIVDAETGKFLRGSSVQQRDDVIENESGQEGQ